MSSKDRLNASLDEDACWAVMQTRDADLPQNFICAVLTTRIYCRVGCPARLPKRENVRFFRTTAEAKLNGFRACLRCHPDNVSVYSQQSKIVESACRIIEKTPNIRLQVLAEKLDLSPSHFHRLFKKQTGITPKEYAKSQRLKRVKASLRTQTTVTDAIYDAGFTSSSRFYEIGAKELGMKPKTVQRGGTDTIIFYALSDSCLGRFLVAATEKGVCAIQMGEEDHVMIAELESRFPNAQFRLASEGFEAWISEIAAYCQTPANGIELPLDIQGTAFQKRVWDAMQTIPVGTTWSYSQLADAIGHPKAVRAVANACAKNKIALVIPCHRVVRLDGSPSGYRWGLGIKEKLIEGEKQQ